MVKKEVEKWREELEVALRSEGILSIIDASESNWQASKWLVDKGWDKNKVGRPSKSEAEREKRIATRVNDEFNADIIRMSKYAKEA
jgi:hypothetical protein